MPGSGKTIVTGRAGAGERGRDLRADEPAADHDGARAVGRAARSAR